MSWIYINKNTFTAYCRRHNIEGVAKVFVEDKFDGSVDGVMPVNKEELWSLDKICQTGKYGRHLIYDSDMGTLRGIDIACGSCILIDERFKELCEMFKARAVVKAL